MLDLNTAPRADEEGNPIPGSWAYPPLSAFSLILLNGKRPVESGWQRYCREKSGLKPEHRNGHNVGVACGPASGVIVLDVDDCDAFATAREKNGWMVPDTYTVETGGGGLHYYFQYPQGGRYGNKACKADGFDIRGDGGQVVAPGSVHPDTGKQYRLVKGVPIAPAPDWLLGLYEEKPKPGTSRRFNSDEIDRLPVKESTKDLIRYGAAKGNRSERIMTAINALVFANLSDADIFSIFERYPIGEKYLEKGDGRDRWLQVQIDKARSYVSSRADDRQQYRRQDRQEQRSVCIDDFVLNGLSCEMEKQMLEDKFVLGRLAILGQMTIFYAPPNAGKTLLVIWGLIRKIKSGDVRGADIYYVNADDNFKGLTQKLKLAEKYGFFMLAPGHAIPGRPVLKANDMPAIFDAMVDAGAAKGRVLVLDTVKKFTSLMDKERGSAFNEIVRRFVSHGGTAILLAHVNKHRDADKKVIHAGTTDLKDDCDCAYTLDIVTTDSSGIRTVKFENLKNRGDVLMEACFQYDSRPESSYLSKLASVVEVNERDMKKAEKRQALEERFRRNLRAIEAIVETFQAGICEGKLNVINATVERTGMTKKYVESALVEHTGKRVRDFQFWKLTIGERGTQIYELNPEASW